MKQHSQVDIPLIFFSLAFFIILFGLFSRFSFQQKKFIEPTTQQNTTSNNVSGKKVPTLNYNLPLLCNYNTKDSNISATLAGTQAYIEVLQNDFGKRYILDGDCLYSWTIKEQVGKKQCGIGQYVGVVKQLLGSGLASTESIIQMAKQSGKTRPFDVGAVIKTCKNVKEVEKGMFVLPKNVVFK